jgi:ABC-2 type transport system ATP-binding protein
MLIIKNITVSYGKNEVLKDLSLTAHEGMIHGLAGLNGSGKTTLLNCLFGLIKPVSGEILLNDKQLTRNQIAYLETQNYFYPGITGKEYLSLFPDVANNFKLKDWKDLLKFPVNELIENYSSGMKKKLALLAIVKLNKKIILLDEPFNNLDMESAYILKIVIRKFREQGKIVILTSHIIETLNDTCDFIHHLQDGFIERSYTPAEFMQLDEKLRSNIEEKTQDLIGRIYA